MFKRAWVRERPILAWGLAAGAILVGSGILGYILGSLGGQPVAPRTDGTQVDAPIVAESPAPNDEASQGDPPVYFYLNVDTSTAGASRSEEFVLAAKAGVRRFVVPMPVPWEGAVSEAALDWIDAFVEAHPDAELTLALDLDPPPLWFERYPTARALSGEGPHGYATPAAPAWRTAVAEALDVLTAALRDRAAWRAVKAVHVTALAEGQWQLAGGGDASPDYVAAFRAWLAGRYGGDDTLRTAWGDDDAALDTARVPAPPDAEDGAVFLDGPTAPALADAQRFASYVTADALMAVAASVRSAFGDGVAVWAPYGHAFEAASGGSGHFAMEPVLASGSVDVFTSPVSQADRRRGGTGGFMAPVDAALRRGAGWVVFDDTRTGIERNRDTGAVERVADINLADVTDVLRRNFAASLTHGIGICWTDAQGVGAFAAPELWTELGAMCAVYGAHDAGAYDAVPPVFPPASLAVVVSEEARHLEHPEADSVAVLLGAARDSALRAGVPVRFHLLSDCLSSSPPEANVYLFVNAFMLTEQERATLHKLLADRQAMAIWLYAPGYFGGAAAVENVSQTVGMEVEVFDGPAVTGSAFVERGRWIRQGDAFGGGTAWSPLFYVADDEVSILARYRDSDEPSAAIAFPEEGWISVYVAEPALTPGLLREFLQIAGVHIFGRGNATEPYDVTMFSAAVLGVHSAAPGERIFEFEGPHTLRDLFDPDVGWPGRRSVAIPMKAGETRLYHVQPTPEGDE